MRRRWWKIGAGAGLVASLALLVATGKHPAPAAMARRELAGTPAGMVYVPAGSCRLGSDDADADEDVRPSRRVSVASFYIDRTEVTNREFRRFRPDWPVAAGEEDLPVTDVTYDEAAAYAKWARKRLPTNDEWEKAARGTDGRRYPWGNEWDQHRVAARAHRKAPAVPASGPSGRCRLGASRVQPVASVPEGVSPYGCLDMAGNAWEWVQGFNNGDHRQRILRGGAVGYGERSCRTYNRAVEGAGAT